MSAHEFARFFGLACPEPRFIGEGTMVWTWTAPEPRVPVITQISMRPPAVSHLEITVRTRPDYLDTILSQFLAARADGFAHPAGRRGRLRRRWRSPHWR